MGHAHEVTQSPVAVGVVVPPLDAAQEGVTLAAVAAGQPRGDGQPVADPGAGEVPPAGQLAEASVQDHVVPGPGGGDLRPQPLGDAGQLVVAGLGGDGGIEGGRAHGLGNVTADVQHGHAGQGLGQPRPELGPGPFRGRGKPLVPAAGRVVDRQALRHAGSGRHQRSQRLVRGLAEHDPGDLPADRPGLPVVGGVRQQRGGRPVVAHRQDRVALSRDEQLGERRRGPPVPVVVVPRGGRVAGLFVDVVGPQVVGADRGGPHHLHVSHGRNTSIDADCGQRIGRKYSTVSGPAGRTLASEAIWAF